MKSISKFFLLFLCLLINSNLPAQKIFPDKNLDEKDDGGKWNVVLGKDFGTHVVHKSRKYGLFQVGELQILIWQSG